MDPVLIVSPHLDDAVLSVGQFMASWPGAVVLSVFAGMPKKEKITSFDVNCGFQGSTRALTERWHEDDRALDVLGATPVRLDFLDNQYRNPEDDIDLLRMVANIVDTYRATRSVKLIGPLGLAHVDHEVTAKATVMAADELGCEAWLYEDVPARILWPEQVQTAVERTHDFKFNPHLGFLGNGDKELKRKAVRCYASQLWALDQDVVFVPERVWFLAR